MLCDAVMASLAQGSDNPSLISEEGISTKYTRLINVLSACSSFDDSVSAKEKNMLLSELLIAAHCLTLYKGEKLLKWT